MAEDDPRAATARYPICPACGGGERTPCNLQGEPPNRYALKMARAVGMDPLALRSALPLWTCRRCGTHWHDPWLSHRAAEWLYNRGYPIHQAGWGAAAAWLQHAPDAHLRARAEVWRMLRGRWPGTLRYAELNCPLSGLMFAELDARRRGGHRLDAPPADPALLADCALLLEPSPQCWGAECRSKEGLRCRAAAARVFGRTMTLSEADAAGARFDAAGAWLTIDHVPDPTATLRRLLDLSRVVILQMHPPGWTDIQHLYSLGPGWLDMVRRDGVTVRDVTEQAYRGGRPERSGPPPLYMMSRADDLGWLG